MGELVYYEGDDEEEDADNYGFEDLFIPNAPIKIEDYPKYAHRGLMLGKLFRYKRIYVCVVIWTLRKSTRYFTKFLSC